MRDYFDIGQTLAVHEAWGGTLRRSQKENCDRLIELCRETFGLEPEGAHFEAKYVPQTECRRGNYYRVLCHFDTNILASAEYAERCRQGVWEMWQVRKEELLKQASE